MIIYSCCVGSFLISIMYIGFIFLAYNNGLILINSSNDSLINAISVSILGSFYGGIICICASFACLATSLVLADISSNYLYEQIFLYHISKKKCLIFVICIMYSMTCLGFNNIMIFVEPVLDIVYPSLIVLCLANIIYKLFNINFVKSSFYFIFIYLILIKI